MRFDEKPKRRSFHLKKSRAGISRDSDLSRLKKTPKIEKLKEELEEPLVFKREKPMKLPEDYDEDETFRESLTSAIKNHVPLIAAGVALLIAIGFFTGTIQRIFTHEETQENTAAAATESTFLVNPTKTVFTQGKFNLSTENTDAGVEIICDTITDDEGNEKKTCHAKTEEDKKREEEEKEREEQEKKAKEEREKEEKEDQEAKEKKAKSSSESSSGSKSTEKETTPKASEPVRATGITSISGCPAEAAAGNLIVLKATVLPFNAENQNIIWSTTSSASVVYDGTGNTATVSVHAGEKVIVTAMTVDGGYTEHCVFPIVAELTE